MCSFGANRASTIPATWYGYRELKEGELARHLKKLQSSDRVAILHAHRPSCSSMTEVAYGVPRATIWRNVSKRLKHWISRIILGLSSDNRSPATNGMGVIEWLGWVAARWQRADTVKIVYDSSMEGEVPKKQWGTDPTWPEGKRASSSEWVRSISSTTIVAIILSHIFAGTKVPALPRALGLP